MAGGLEVGSIVGHGKAVEHLNQSEVAVDIDLDGHRGTTLVAVFIGGEAWLEKRPGLGSSWMQGQTRANLQGFSRKGSALLLEWRLELRPSASARGEG